MFDISDSCLFCEREKSDWKSAIVAKLEIVGTIDLALFTVCPDCRSKHTVQEMYEKVIEKMRAWVETIL